MYWKRNCWVSGLCSSSICLVPHTFLKVVVPFHSLPSLGIVTLFISGNLMDVAWYLVSSELSVLTHLLLWTAYAYLFACFFFSVRQFVIFTLICIIVLWLYIFWIICWLYVLQIYLSNLCFVLLFYNVFCCVEVVFKKFFKKNYSQIHQSFVVSGLFSPV